MTNNKNNEWNEALQACANALEEERARVVERLHNAKGNDLIVTQCLAQIEELWNVRDKLIALKK